MLPSISTYSRNGSRSRDGGNSGLFGFIHPLYPSKTGADADAPTGGATFGRGKGGKPSKLFFHLSEVMVSENSTNGNADTSADTVNVVDADVKKERTKAGNASVSSNAGEQSLDIRNDPSYANANRNISTSARVSGNDVPIFT